MSRIDGSAGPKIDNAVVHRGEPRAQKVQYGYDEKDKLVVSRVNFWDDEPFYNMITGKPQGKIGVSFNWGQQYDAQHKLGEVQLDDSWKEAWRTTLDTICKPFGGAPGFLANAPRSKGQIEQDQRNVVNQYMMEKYEGIKPQLKLV